MRVRSTLSLFAVLLVGITAKLTFIDAHVARAVPSSAGVDIQTLQRSVSNLPLQNVQDMTFVFVD